MEMNRRYIGARQVRIGWSDHHILKHCVHVHFDGDAMTESALRVTFGRFGALKLITLPRAPTTHKLKGFAFVQYDDSEQGEQSAHAAISTITHVDGVHVQCAYGKRQTQRTRSANAPTLQANTTRTRQYSQPNAQTFALAEYNTSPAPFADAYVSYATMYEAEQVYLSRLQPQVMSAAPQLLHLSSAVAYPSYLVPSFSSANAIATQNAIAQFNFLAQHNATRI